MSPLCVHAARARACVAKQHVDVSTTSATYRVTVNVRKNSVGVKGHLDEKQASCGHLILSAHPILLGWLLEYSVALVLVLQLC